MHEKSEYHAFISATVLRKTGKPKDKYCLLDLFHGEHIQYLGWSVKFPVSFILGGLVSRGPVAAQQISKHYDQVGSHCWLMKQTGQKHQSHIKQTKAMNGGHLGCHRRCLGRGTESFLYGLKSCLRSSVGSKFLEDRISWKVNPPFLVP